MFRAMPRVFALATFAIALVSSSRQSASAQQTGTVPAAVKGLSKPTPHGLPTTNPRSFQPRSGPKPLNSRTTPLDGSGTAGALKNFPGVQNADIVLAGHAVSDSAFVDASLSLDVDGDGRPDIVTVQFDGTLNVLLNPGSGGLGEWQRKTNKSVSFTSSVYNGAGIDYVYAADLNNDGLPDLITVSYLARTIYVYLNAGQGVFQNATAYQLPFHFGGALPLTGGLAIGDVDGDGYPDIVALGTQVFYPDASSSAMEALTLINAKDGTFSAAQAGDVSVLPGYLQATYSGVKLADVNGNGKLELVFVAAEAFSDELFLATVPSTPNHLFNNLLPAIPTSQISGYGIADQTLGALVLQDVDGDHIVDAIFQEGSDVFLAKGNSSGGFDPPTSVLSISGGALSSSFADLNGDGNLDAIIYGNSVTSIYMGTGSGHFSPAAIQIPGGSRATLGVGDRQVPDPIDVDGDGLLDLVQLDTDTGAIGINLNSATGFHTSQVLVPDPINYNGMYSAGLGSIKSPGSVDLVTIGVANGAAYDVSPPILAVTNDGSGNFLSNAYHTLLSSAQTTNVNVLLSTKAVAAIADINGDGLSDLLLTTGPNGNETIGGGLAVSFNKGDYTFTYPVRLTTQSFDFSCNLERTTTGDLNHDGKPDFITTYRGNSCSNAFSFPGLPAGYLTYLSQPDGSYKSSFTAYGQYPSIPVLADLNGDGNLDLILAESDGYQTSGLTVLKGLGDGTFDVGSPISVLPTTAQISSVTAGDYDGDGKQDLIIGLLAQLDGGGNPVDNTTGLLLMKGGGDFTFEKGTLYMNGSQIWASRLGDLDGDGLPDLALNVTTAAASGYTSLTDGAVPEPGLVLLPNLGAGIFGTPRPIFGSTSDIGVSIPSPPVDGSLELADLNGDGALDVLNDNSYEPAVYLNVGATTFSVSATPAAILQGAGLTLSASLQGTVNRNPPTGSVSFYANGALLGNAPVQSGSASLTTTSLSPGSYTITAIYSGDANFNAEKATTSAAVTVSTLTPDFTLAAPAPTALSLPAGKAGIVTLLLTANDTFNGSITLGCAGAASGMQCLVSPAALTLTPGQGMTVTVAITTQSASSAHMQKPLQNWKGVTGGLSVASVFIFALGKRRRKIASYCALLTVGVFASLCVTGCAGGTNTNTAKSNATTPAGTYTLTLSAYGGSSMHSQTVAVTVTR